MNKNKEGTGWKHTHTPEYRRKLVLESTDKRQSKYKRYLQSGRKMMAVANVHTGELSKVAKQDADYFFGLVRKLKNKRSSK